MDAADTQLVSELHSTPWLLQADDEWDPTALEEHGLLVGRKILPTTNIEGCRQFVLQSLDTALTLPLDESSCLLGEIRAPLFRHDIKLALHPDLLALLGTLIRSPLGHALASALGEEASLCELSCLVSEGGAAAQPAHCDTSAIADEAAGASKAGALYTVFIPLQQIDADMGPTTMWPSTHIPAFHAAVHESHAALRSCPSVQMDLGPGSAVVMDSRLWHFGGANNSSKRRCLLVASFARAGSSPKGSTYSMIPDLVDRHTLRSLRADTSEHGTGEVVAAVSEDEEQEEEKAAIQEGEEAEEAEEIGDIEKVVIDEEQREEEEEEEGEEEEADEDDDDDDDGHDDDEAEGMVPLHMAPMPVAAVEQLGELAMTLPWQEEPRANQCVAALVVSLQRAQRRAQRKAADAAAAQTSWRPVATAGDRFVAVVVALAAVGAHVAAAFYDTWMVGLASVLCVVCLVCWLLYRQRRSHLQPQLQPKTHGLASSELAYVPVAVLRLLFMFRVLGPHMRSSSQWGPLQRLADAALADAEAAGMVQMTDAQATLGGDGTINDPQQLFCIVPPRGFEVQGEGKLQPGHQVRTVRRRHTGGLSEGAGTDPDVAITSDQISTAGATMPSTLGSRGSSFRGPPSSVSSYDSASYASASEILDPARSGADAE